MSWVLKMVVLLLAGLLWVQAEPLIRVGDTWKYFKGTEPPSEQPNDWTQAEFNDADWLSGGSGFTYGFGRYDQNTILQDMRGNYVSVYLRRKFHVEDLEAVGQLILRIDHTGGFVAYLNGEEIARRGLPGNPGEPVAYTAEAEFRLLGNAEEIIVFGAADLLKEGENILAIQGHNSDLFKFSYGMVPELWSNLVRGPLLQSTSANGTLITWKTAAPQKSLLRYGVEGPDEQVWSWDTPTNLHLAVLEDLKPDTRYYYRCEFEIDGETYLGKTYAFRTLKEQGPFSFLVVGDTGEGSPAQFAVAHQMGQVQADLGIFVGDVVYPHFTLAQVDLKCFSVYQPQMARRPYFFGVGNHDRYGNQHQFFEAFFMPTNPVTGTEHYYSFDHGDAHFAVLDSDLQAGANYSVGSPQYEWLKQDLESSKKPWKFLFLHHAFRTSSLHRFDDYDLNGVMDRLQLEQSIGTLASEQGVDVVFAGHDHVYERLRPSGGFHSIVTGGGGAVLYGFRALDETSVQWHQRHHFVRVEVEEKRLSLEAVGTNGAVFDRMTLSKAPAESGPYHLAPESSPIVEVAGEGIPNGHGNLQGQTFDFQDRPIPFLTGRESNPGEFFASMDEEFLYMGIGNCMIGSDADLLLFLDVPGLDGVQEMTGLGNNTLDPEGEGVDGLDFLQLGFTGFKPDAALILGRETVDGTQRSFESGGARFNSGQGGFYLQPGFPEIPNVRIQQFHQSPQTGANPDEDNADFIEIALPLAALGDLDFEDPVYVGAVVAYGGVEPDAPAGRRTLDSSFLGSEFNQTDTGHLLAPAHIIFHVPDSDQDGLTYFQEIERGTDPENMDTDGDGLPDGWESEHGLDPLNSKGREGASGDQDEDGLNNQEEWWLHSHPGHSASGLKLEMTSMEKGGLLFRWFLVPGAEFRLESGESVDGPFNLLYKTNAPSGFDVQTHPLKAEWHLENPEDRPGFFRLQMMRSSPVQD